jgi:hypothetical protein
VSTMRYIPFTAIKVSSSAVSPPVVATNSLPRLVEAHGLLSKVRSRGSDPA